MFVSIFLSGKKLPTMMASELFDRMRTLLYVLSVRSSRMVLKFKTQQAWPAEDDCGQLHLVREPLTVEREPGCPAGH